MHNIYALHISYIQPLCMPQSFTTKLLVNSTVLSRLDYCNSYM